VIFTKVRVHGNKIISFLTKDEAAFKESEHPRAKNGEFAKAPGGSPSAKIKNGITKPKPNSPQGKVWEWVEKFTSENGGKYPTPSQITEKAATEGWSKQYTPKCVKFYKQFHEEQKGTEESKGKEHKEEEKPKPEPEPEPKKIANTVENFKKIAEELGYKYEGKYNGVEYYKVGNQKLSYSPEAETWAYKEGGSTINIGNELSKMALAPKAAPVASYAGESYSQTKTGSAPIYASSLPTSNFKYSSKGISDESGLPSGIQKSIHRYKGSYYQQINKAMRFSTDFHEVDKQTMVDILNIQRAFQIAPPTKNDVNVGRKFGIEAFKAMAKNAGIDDLNDIQPGTILSEEAVCSTSHSKSVWSGDVHMNILIPKGAKAIDLSETINAGEKETILPPGTKFKINSITQGNAGSYKLDCEVLL